MSDSQVVHKVIVSIFGDEYPITGVSDPEYIRKVAALVDSRMKDIARISRSQARDKIAILTAMSLASELVERSELLNSTQTDQDTCVETLLSRLDEALSSASGPER